MTSQLVAVTGQQPVARAESEDGGAPPGAPQVDRRPAHERFMEALEDLLRDRDRRRSGDRRLLERGSADRRGGEAALPRPEPVPVGRYAATVGGLTTLLMASLAIGNFHLAPMTYDQEAHKAAAEAFVAGRNYAVFDLNLDTRGLRRAHLEQMAEQPEVIVYGASHWQEAHADLLPERSFYNAHVHRDYHEDVLGLVEMLIRYDRLPETLIISVRDLTFASPESRTDYLWLTGTYDYRSMAARLGIEPPGWLTMQPERHYLGLLSLPTLVENGVRWWSAPVQPGPVDADRLPTLDVLQADGSIRWAAAHQASFTAERRQAQVEAAVRERRERRPEIDPAAVEAIDRLLELLRQRGVEVVLIHPPFNPEFYARIAGSPYGDGLLEVEALTRRLAERHGATAVGSFDPATTGCRAEMFIDAEHGNPDCLRRVLDQVPGLHTGGRTTPATAALS